jgi:DNA replication protein DnaC
MSTNVPHDRGWLFRPDTHLAIGLALQACTARRSVLFTSAADLLDQLVAAEVSHTLGKTLDQLRRLDLLVVDELGYLPMDGRRANLFFQLVAARYTRGSLLVTSNVSFDGWGRLFGDDVIASAILDRLLHQSEIFAINGHSYRLKDKLTTALD